MNVSLRRLPLPELVLFSVIAFIAPSGRCSADETDPPGRRHVLKSEEGETFCSVLVPQGWKPEAPRHIGNEYIFRFVPVTGTSPVLSLSIRPSNESARIYFRKYTETLEPRPLFARGDEETGTGYDPKRDVVWNCSHSEEALVAKATVSRQRMIDLTLEESLPAPPFVLATLAHVVDSIDFEPAPAPAGNPSEEPDQSITAGTAPAELDAAVAAESRELRFAMRESQPDRIRWRLVLFSSIIAAVGCLFLVERLLTRRRHERQVAEVERAIQNRRIGRAENFTREFAPNPWSIGSGNAGDGLPPNAAAD